MHGLEGIDPTVFRVGPRRWIIQDLHGPWAAERPLWPTPYHEPVGSPRRAASLRAPMTGAPMALWWHGELVAVATEQLRAHLGEAYGAHRVRGAAVGDVAAPDVPDADRELVAAFLGRGWQRLLVRAFHTVGCKTVHVGPEAAARGLAAFPAVAEAIAAARGRHRLAVLEELVRATGHDPDAVFARLDAADRALDDAGMGGSWMGSVVPEHARALWPLRNLMRLCERRGALFRKMRWRDYEAEDSYAPELAVICLDAEIYGAGVEHDVTHFVAPVLYSRDQLAFEVGNNGIEGDAQAMNNLILACHHTGPAYEGYAGWPGAPLFEWLERAFGVASIPQMIAALRAFTVVLHKRFVGDAAAVLEDLVPSLADTKAREDLLRFYPRYVQHDHDFLGQLHGRYLTPIFEAWRARFGDRVTDDMGELVRVANDVLWTLEDLDLRTWDHPLRGRIGNTRERHRAGCFKLIELEQLLAMGAPASRLAGRTAALLRRGEDLDLRFGQLAVACGASVDGTAPAERDPAELGTLEESHGRLAVEAGRLRDELATLVAEVRAAQAGWTSPVVPVPADFATSWAELFRGFFYEPPTHIGDDMDGRAKSLG